LKFGGFITAFQETRMTLSKDTLRKRLFAALSDLYAKEVPLYDKLLETVREVNRRIAAADPDRLPANRSVEEISAERHGAIRLGRPDELRDMGRFFACLNMFPVNFYNLAEAGAKSQPVISTAFRPLQDADHRIFCSLLMPECFPPDFRKRVESALAERRIFTPELLGLMQKMEAEGALEESKAESFIAEAKQLFGWRGEARDRALYRDLVGAKLNIAADIACFPNPHLNHLTPNSLDIDALYAEMSQRLKGPYAHLPHRGMKDSIEGPPRRDAPILLRQTAYNALDEAVRFVDASGDEANAVHRARFGEIEQRGVALTPKGRALYDEAIADPDPETAFARIPDSFEELRRDDLAYFRSSGNGHEPVRYEDFLPISAAGIFASNLGQYGTRMEGAPEVSFTQDRLEGYLEAPITDAYKLYADATNAPITHLPSL
jgi:uncharacterized glyoxalase superfamily metalloenzyme YdcJ